MKWWLVSTLAVGWLVMISGATAQGDGSGRTALVRVPERFESAYLKHRPRRFLVDPQRVLADEDFREQLEFLDYHAGDSAIDLYVCVFNGDQLPPDEDAAARAVAGWFGDGKPAVLVHYFMGKPERAAMFLCPALDAVVTPVERARALETAVARAGEEALVSNQLGKFLVEMSIRLYWIERLLSQEPATAGGDGAGPEAADEPAGPPSQQELLLQWAGAYGLQAGIGGVALLILLLVRRQLKKRARYRFADLEVEPRLGGPHAAGVGAVISFASAALPPGAQRES